MEKNKRFWLLLHWWEGNWNNSWFPSTKKYLEKLDIETFNPDLTNSEKPNIEEQLKDLEKYDFIKENSVIISHSLWWILNLKFIEKNDIKNSQIFLVAPAYDTKNDDYLKNIVWNNYSNLEKYFSINIDFDKLNSLNNTYKIFLSENDKFINLDFAKKTYSKLDWVEFTLFKDKWHFTTRDWVLELPELTELIK